MSGALKLGYRPDEAAAMLGSEQLLLECKEAGWIKPTVQRNKLTLYDGSDLVGCWARIRRGEMPPRIERKTRKEGTDA